MQGNNETEKELCVFNKSQKQPQCTCQTKKVIASSLIPCVALLVLSSGTNYP